MQYTYWSISQEVKVLRQWNLVSYNITWGIFFWKYHTQNMVEKLVPEPFPKKIEHIFGSTVWKFIHFVFIVCPSRGLPKLLIHIKFFRNTKWRSGTSLPATFGSWFVKKMFFTIYSINWPNSFVSLPEILGNMSIVIVCFPVYDVINFEINPSFIMKPFSYIIKKVRTKIPVGIYLLKVKNRNTRTRCEICSKLTIKTPERRRFGVFIVNFETISHLVLVFLFLTLNM